MAQVTTRLPEPEDFEDAALEEALAASSAHLLAALRHSAEQGVFGAEDSRKLHRMRAAAHAAGALIPVPGANHFTILQEFEKPSGILVRAALDLVG